MSSLTRVQQQVLVLLAEGSTVSAAVQITGIHRNTIANWRRASSGFRDTWARVQYEQAMHWRDEMQSLCPLAIETLRGLLTGAKASPSVRLRAALAVLNKLSVPAPLQPEYAEARRKDAPVDWALETLLGPLPPLGAQPGDAPGDAPGERAPHPCGDAAAPLQARTQPESVHNAAQVGPIEPDLAPIPALTCYLPQKLQPATVHNLAQACTTVRHQAPQPGRNSACPCGSGLKYKRCCLGRSTLSKAA